MLHEGTSEGILRCAIKVHRALGPGLLESAYEACLLHEMRKQELAVLQQVRVPVTYDGIEVECGFRADFIVDGLVLVELKAVERLHALHESQLLTYLRLTRLRVGLLLNFNSTNITKGMRRLVL